MLPNETGPNLAVGQWKALWAGFPWEIEVGGNFLCWLIIVVILMGLGGTYRLGEILNSSSEGAIFYGGVDPSRHSVNILILQLEEGWNAWKVKKWGREKLFISCSYSCTT